MNPDFKIFEDRSRFYRTIRSFFDGRGYLETETPLFTPDPIPEHSIDLFSTRQISPGGKAESLYLVPSPEVWLKRLLAAGAPSLYQIGKCFRNGEQHDLWHRREFTMLEWYSVALSSAENLNIMQDLIDQCAALFQPDAGLRIARMSMEEAFLEFAGFSLESDLTDAGLTDTGPESPDYPAALEQAAMVLSARLDERGLPSGDERADDLFHRLFITLVEDQLPSEHPLALTEWPALIPTLARRVPQSPWADRWELYLNGVEIANCYGEENDLDRLTAYWAAENPAEFSAEWPQAVSCMPDCSGVAAGLDRLLALLRGDSDLSALDFFC